MAEKYLVDIVPTKKPATQKDNVRELKNLMSFFDDPPVRLCAKSGTDKAESSSDILQARYQLGHTTVVMTAQYIRNRKGKKVSPTK
ncbi:hypothetical protein [Pseudomonas synxantha]|uniref:Uncharacterized protein n=1 Tax=Pseudomonas synxantha TaxID=47883 RepID=A0ACC6JSQ9_9PSED|nr:hypothetical protein [Pseudomonas synxantha]